MLKVTPDPPTSNHHSLDHCLKSTPEKLRFSDLHSDRLFTVAPDIDTESLLANASQDLAAVKVMAADLAFEIEGSRRTVALAICRMAEGAQLLVDKALDNLDPPTTPTPRP